MTRMRDLWTDPETGNQHDLAEVPFPYWDDQWKKDIGEIEGRYNCRHEHSRLVRKTIANGTTQFRNQCTRCGDLFGSPLKHELAPPGTPQVDLGLEEHRRCEIRQACIRAIQRHNEWHRWYDSYLTSDKWLAKRELVFAQSGGVCEGCQERRADQVHHLTYKNVGDELLYQLVAVCKTCHERLHETRDGN
jgi:hypothetical protein